MNITLSLYKRLALEMAIRHPRVIALIGKPNKYYFDGSDFIGCYDSSYIDDEVRDELYYDFGIDASSVEFTDDGDEIPVSDINRARICKPPIKMKMWGDTYMLPSEKNTLFEPPTKLCITNKAKGGLMISTIYNNNIFEWYDSFYKISGIAPYQLDPSKNTTNKAKKDCKILHDWITNKRWFELLP